MRRALAYLCISSLCASPAAAKPGGGKVGACEASLRLTRAAIEAQGLLWITTHDGLFSLILFGPKDLRTRKIRLIREHLEARSTPPAMFSPHDARPENDERVTRDAADFGSVKGLTERFATAPVVIVDSLEDLIHDFTPAGRAANEVTMRKILSERLQNRRPTILTLDDVSSGDRHLRDL